MHTNGGQLFQVVLFFYPVTAVGSPVAIRLPSGCILPVTSVRLHPVAPMEVGSRNTTCLRQVNARLLPIAATGHGMADSSRNISINVISGMRIWTAHLARRAG